VYGAFPKALHEFSDVEHLQSRLHVYCYIPHRGETVEPCDCTIDLEFAVAGMKEFFSWAPEPAIGFKRMTEIVEEGKLVGDRLQVELQTNGYFNAGIADWVSDNVDILWISCDGPPKYQDAQRPSVNGTRRSSPLVEANIKRFATHPTMQVGAHATFLQENFDKQIEVLDYFRSLGLKYVCGAPACSSTLNDHTPVPMLVRFAQEFVPAFYHA
jgi:uncharacterized protein